MNFEGKLWIEIVAYFRTKQHLQKSQQTMMKILDYLDLLKESQEKLSQVKRNRNLRRKIKRKVLEHPQLLLSGEENMMNQQNLAMMEHFAG